MSKRALIFRGAPVAVLLVSACGGAAPGVATRQAPAPAATQLFAVTKPSEPHALPPIESYFSKSCALSAGKTPESVHAARQGSSVVLATWNGTDVAYVADKDDKSVAVFDLEKHQQIGAVPLYGAPEQMLLLDDGRLVVAIGDSSHVEAFAPTSDASAPLERLCAREVAPGPYGLAASRDGGTIALTSGFDPTLTVLDGELRSKSTTHLARAPRGVWIDDKRQAFVTHLVGGALSVVAIDRPDDPASTISLAVRPSVADSNTGEKPLRRGSQEFVLTGVEIHPDGGTAERPPLAGAAPRLPVPMPAARRDVETRLVVPMVTVDPGSADRATENYYGPPPFGGITKQAPIAIAVDPSRRIALTKQVEPPAGSVDAKACLQPRAAAGHSKREMVYVACLGTNELLELDARATDPMKNVKRRFDVPSGPLGVAIDETNDVAVVYGQFDHRIGIVDLGTGDVESYDVPGLGEKPTDGELRLRRGRALFYQSDAQLVSSDSLACSSCHPDGLEDGLTWFTPDGPRQTPMLAGRLSGTAPYGWARNQKTLETYITDTASRLGGKMAYFQAGDIATYITSIGAPPKRARSGDLVAKGEQVFASKACTTCHVGGAGVDGHGHDFDKTGTSVDTPSLANVLMTPPYFHDGRYANLSDLLADKKSNMGATAHLSADERAELEAYLDSL